MNDVIKTILNHRSIRSFQSKALTNEQIQTIVASAQAASTSSFVQAYTIIGVSDEEKKEALAVLSGNQAYVAKNGHFFVFCLDLHRLRLAAMYEGMTEDEIYDAFVSTELYTVAVIDTALAAQNAALAAEAMGLGICYIGGVRNNLEEVSRLLQTPDYVVPLFGLCVGYIKHVSGKKPRLPQEAVYHQEVYLAEDKHIAQLAAYNKTISAYYKQRTDGKRTDRWTQQIAKKLKNPQRLYLKSYLQSKKLPLM
jgi:FMN reductase (NADPH)